MRKQIDIAIAEDHDLVREGLIVMLKEHKYIKVLFEARNGKELIAGLEQQQPDVILLDIVMPMLDGIKTLKKIRRLYPKIKIVVVSGFSEDSSVVEYVKLGANSFLPKNCNSASLVDAIYKVSKYGRYFEEPVLKLLEKNGIMPLDSDRELSKKEIFVLKLLCQDKSLESIAEITGTSVKTVYWYRYSIQNKTKCFDLPHLKIYARKLSLA
jgi:DNA-binding NarL/FixJ family response regulator